MPGWNVPFPLWAEQVYLTIDLDVLDPSIMPSTGTPEPGGMEWNLLLNYLKRVFEVKEVVGFDLVEFAPMPSLTAPDFLVAKLYYKLLSYKFQKSPEAMKDQNSPIRAFMQTHFRHFNSAALVDAAIGYEAQLKQGNRMMITLAGAMSTAELGKSLAEMIRQEKVHIISCTGANLEEDLMNLVAHSHYKRIPGYRDLSSSTGTRIIEPGAEPGHRHLHPGGGSFPASAGTCVRKVEESRIGEGKIFSP